MRINLLGHASLVVETEKSTIFMDPVFGDPFQGELVVSCPARVVDVEALPQPTALILSHGHLDHVHHPSLQRLPKHIPVYIPKDGDLLRTLLALGFANVFPQSAWDSVTLGDVTCTFTPSAGPAVELGVLWQHRNLSVWNQVDTVITQQTCAQVAGLCPKGLDLAFCGYRPLLEYAGMWIEEEEFPTARYHRMLEMALCTGARVLVPGSAGLRAADELDWVNHRLFPGERKTFARDVQALEPSQLVMPMDPGDELTFHTDGKAVVRAGHLARTTAADEDRVTFDPKAHPAPAMMDRNPRGYTERAMRQVIEPLLEDTLQQALRAALGPGLVGPLRTLWNRRHTLQMEVYFPSGKEVWHVAAWTPQPTVVRGPLKDADYTWRYLASDIHTLVQGQWVQPTVQAVRRKGRAPGRLDTLDPARLHGVDVYHVVDETFEWNPLTLLA